LNYLQQPQIYKHAKTEVCPEEESGDDCIMGSVSTPIYNELQASQNNKERFFSGSHTLDNYDMTPQNDRFQQIMEDD
jgi:hypothetical protein